MMRTASAADAQGVAECRARLSRLGRFRLPGRDSCSRHAQVEHRIAPAPPSLRFAINLAIKVCATGFIPTGLRMFRSKLFTR